MRILVAIDGSERSLTAVAAVRSLTIPAGATIECITAMPDDREVMVSAWPALLLATDPVARTAALDEVRARLASVAASLERDGVTVRTRVHRGRPATVILHEAAAMPADLIVLGAVGHGAVERLILGSVSAEVVDHAPCPVLVVRSPQTRRLVIATDGSPDAGAAATFVARSGLFADPEVVHVVTVIDPVMPWWVGLAPVDGSAAMASVETVQVEARAQAAKAAAVAMTALSELPAVGATVATGDVPSAILEAAATCRADVVVVGTRGHGAVHRALVGSTSRHVLHHAPMSVLIVPSPMPAQHALPTSTTEAA